MLSDRHRALHVTFLVAYERTTNRGVFELMTQSKHESFRKVGTGARMRLNNADKKVFAFQFSGFFFPPCCNSSLGPQETAKPKPVTHLWMF